MYLFADPDMKGKLISSALHFVLKCSFSCVLLFFLTYPVHVVLLHLFNQNGLCFLRQWLIKNSVATLCVTYSLPVSLNGVTLHPVSIYQNRKEKP